MSENEREKKRKLREEGREVLISFLFQGSKADGQSNKIS